MRHSCALSVLLISAAVASSAAPADRTLAADAPIISMKISPDSRSVLASCTSQHVHTWDAATGKPSADRKPGGFLLNANLLVERSADRKSVHVWDLAAARQMYTIDKKIAEGAVSPDGKQLAISSEVERNVRLLDAATGTPRRVMEDGVGGSASIAFSPDGSTVVSANYDNDVRVWSTKSGELVRKIEDFSGAMFAAQFTPDGTQLLMAGLDQKIYVFDAKTWKLQRTLTGHGETILAMAISPDGKTVVTGGFDVIAEKNPVKVVFWDLASGKMLRTVRAPHAVTSLAFAPDGSILAMSSAQSKEITLISLASTKP